MKVRELIALLATLNPDDEIVQCLDDCFAPITGASSVEGEFVLIEHPHYRPGGAYDDVDNVENMKSDKKLKVKSGPLTIVCLEPLD